MTYTDIEQAKTLLKKAGYHTDNMAHVDDVKKLIRHISEDDTQEILSDAYTNDFVKESINQGILFAVRMRDIKLRYND